MKLCLWRRSRNLSPRSLSLVGGFLSCPESYIQCLLIMSTLALRGSSDLTFLRVLYFLVTQSIFASYKRALVCTVMNCHSFALSIKLVSFKCLHIIFRTNFNFLLFLLCSPSYSNSITRLNQGILFRFPSNFFLFYKLFN